MKVLSKIKFIAKEHSPELHFALGVVGFVATCVTVYKARPKFEIVLEEHNKAMADRKKAIEVSKENSGGLFYDKKEQRADLVAIWLKTISGTFKAFWKTAIAGCISLWGFGKGYSILSGRLAGMTAAYSALASEKKETVTAETQTEATENGNGNDISAESDNELFPDGYTIVFDKRNPNFEEDIMANRFFLAQKQNWFNNILQSKGYLFLNEVLIGLGYEPIEFGQVLGWRYYKETTKALETGSSNFVDFGIFTEVSKTEKLYDLAKPNDDGSIVLKFNIDKKPLYGRSGLKKK